MSESSSKIQTSEIPQHIDLQARRRVGLTFVAVIVGVLILMQFARFVVPAFKLDNPPVTHDVQWDSARTEELWNVACRDCHSNETVWPWYSYVAPVTFLIANDTHAGREEMNISENHRINGGEMVEKIQEGEMPPAIYTMIHPNANLSDSEKQDLIAGIIATFGRTRGR